MVDDQLFVAFEKIGKFNGAVGAGEAVLLGDSGHGKCSQL